MAIVRDLMFLKILVLKGRRRSSAADGGKPVGRGGPAPEEFKTQLVKTLFDIDVTFKKVIHLIQSNEFLIKSVSITVGKYGAILKVYFQIFNENKLIVCIYIRFLTAEKFFLI